MMCTYQRKCTLVSYVGAIAIIYRAFSGVTLKVMQAEVFITLLSLSDISEFLFCILLAAGQAKKNAWLYFASKARGRT